MLASEPVKSRMKIKVGVVDRCPARGVWQTVEQIERHVDWMADAASITFMAPTAEVKARSSTA